MPSKVEEIVMEETRGCNECQEPKENHLDGKCLWQPTFYRETVLLKDNKGQLLTQEQFNALMGDNQNGGTGGW